MQREGVPAGRAAEGEPGGVHPSGRRLGCPVVLLVVGLALVGLVMYEWRTSYLQSRLFSREAARLTYHLAPGASDSVFFPAEGPMDVRRGYTLIPETVGKLEHQGYRITTQS